MGSCFICVATALLLFSRSLWQVIFAQIAFGIGFSLLNGTHTAMLYDSLLSLNREDEYRRLEGRRQAFALYGIAFAGFLGGFAYVVDPYLPFYLEIGAHLICLLLVGFMREPERHKQQDKQHPIADICETIKYTIHGHATLGVIILSAAVLFSTTKIIMWSQQPYFMALDLPKQYYGVFMSIGWALGGLSSHSAHLIDGKIKIFRALFLAFCASIVACFGAGIVLGFHGIPLLLTGGSCIFGMTLPRVNEAINKNIGSERRATALSTLSLLGSALFIPISSLVGWVTDQTTIQWGLMSLCAWLILSGAGLMWLKIKRAKTA